MSTNVQKLTDDLDTLKESETGRFTCQVLKYTINLSFRDKQITQRTKNMKYRNCGTQHNKYMRA